jgi:hypothetical protein
MKREVKFKCSCDHMHPGFSAAVRHIMRTTAENNGERHDIKAFVDLPSINIDDTRDEEE